MDCNIKDSDWAQKYRPQKLEDMILPSFLFEKLKNMRDSQKGLSLLFHGKAGTGKTTAARLIHDYCYDVDCSAANSGEEVRKLDGICAGVSIWDNLRVVLLDEADYLRKPSQATLRHLIEKHSMRNLFVFTANYPERIIAPLHSRLHPIDFSFNASDSILKERMVKRSSEILENESISVDISIVKTIVRECFPDMRKVLKRLQFEFSLAEA